MSEVMSATLINKCVELIPKLTFTYEFPPTFNSDIIYPLRDTGYDFTLCWKVILSKPNKVSIKLESCTQTGTRGKVTCYDAYKNFDASMTEEWSEQDQFPLQFRTCCIDPNLLLKIRVCIEIKFHTDSKIKKNLAPLIYMNEENWSDVTFALGDQKFKAHRAILAARSQVFAKMFKTDMLENNRNEIEIHDDDPQAFEELLRIIYTGPWQHYVVDDAKALLILADKYQIEDLKIQSAEILKHSLNIDNVIDLLMFADQYNSEFLKTVAIQFFGKNKKEILQKGKYKQIFDSKCSHLIDELFHAML